jgi:hypothetical protein
MNKLKEVCIRLENGDAQYMGYEINKRYTISLEFFAPLSEELSDILKYNCHGYYVNKNHLLENSSVTFNFILPPKNNLIENFKNILQNRSFAFLHIGSSNDFLDMFSKISLKHIDFSYIQKAFPDEE